MSTTPVRHSLPAIATHYGWTVAPVSPTPGEDVFTFTRPAGADGYRTRVRVEFSKRGTVIHASIASVPVAGGPNRAYNEIGSRDRRKAETVESWLKGFGRPSGPESDETTESVPTSPVPLITRESIPSHLPVPRDPSYMVGLATGDRVRISPAPVVGADTDLVLWGVVQSDYWHGEDSYSILLDGEDFPSLLPAHVWSVEHVERGADGVPPIPDRNLSAEWLYVLREGTRVDLTKNADSTYPLARGTVAADIVAGSPFGHVRLDSGEVIPWYTGLMIPVTGTWTEETTEPRIENFVGSERDPFPGDQTRSAAEYALMSSVDEYRFYREDSVPTVPVPYVPGSLLRRFPEDNNGPNETGKPSTWRVIVSGDYWGTITQHGPHVPFQYHTQSLMRTVVYTGTVVRTGSDHGPVELNSTHSTLSPMISDIREYVSTFAPEFGSLPAISLLETLSDPETYYLTDYRNDSDGFPRNGVGDHISIGSLYPVSTGLVREYIDGDPDYEIPSRPCYVEIPNTVSGDYVGDAYNRSNREFLLTQFPSLFIVGSDRLGAETLYLNLGDRIPAELVSLLPGTDYPVVSEDHFYEMETRLRSEYWEEHGRDGFLDAIRDSATEDFDTDTIDRETLHTWESEHILYDSDVWTWSNGDVETVQSELESAAHNFMSETGIPFRIVCDDCGEELDSEPGDTPGGFRCSECSTAATRGRK